VHTLNLCSLVILVMGERGALTPSTCRMSVKNGCACRQQQLTLLYSLAANTELVLEGVGVDTLVPGVMPTVVVDRVLALKATKPTSMNITMHAGTTTHLYRYNFQFSFSLSRC